MRDLVHQYMTDPNPFILFGLDHIIGTIVFLGLWIWLPTYSKNNLTKPRQEQLGIVLGLIVMSNYLVWVGLEAIAGTFDSKLHLPFHLCRFANLAIPFVMIWKKERLFQVLYFWGMSGMLQGAITPDVTHGFPHFHENHILKSGTAFLKFVAQDSTYLLFRKKCTYLKNHTATIQINILLFRFTRMDIIATSNTPKTQKVTMV